jgi:hypothetical protein
MLNGILQDRIYYVNLVCLDYAVLPVQIAIFHLYEYVVTTIYPATVISIQAISSAHIVSAVLLVY